MKGPPLAELQAFAWVAAHRSFRRAAAMNGVSASGLSQAVRSLEDRLGVRLLNRTTRSVAPTDAGLRLLDRLTPALGEIGDALDQVLESQGAVAGPLRINAPEPAVELTLAPLIGDFLKAYPQVRLEIASEPGFVDIVRDGFDAGVRWEESLALDMVAVPLGGRQEYALVASPEVIARDGLPQHPEDLLGRPCIRLKFPSGYVPAWEFERDGRVLKVAPEGPLTTNSIALQLQAALDGVGYLATFEAYVRAPIAERRLVRLLKDWTPSFPGPMLYYPSSRQAPRPLRAFIDFLRARREKA
ncbi:LysR family transcriptional regulator [Phenylobacterium sp.]|uniref:LysR family transcriptional regulator n=1 Tax=Phenylobacterium sp. TaxID=1871053 RepID=UPI002730A085|nr:LysR family transcriptional regulator [Phenylobacterium sp.]MDP1616943.1 LysR family transcriptional regulator [Phenylobacterium sp.]MDP1988388.1 LysR family transcriptional regulator [Phenylobacterium sp.]